MKKIVIRKSKINGLGLFASEAIRQGEKISYIRGPICVIKNFLKLSKKDREARSNWIGASRYRYINTDNSPYKYINHSCNPNAVIITPRTVVARKKIRSGDEITIDYSLTEAGQDWTIHMCTCKEKRCRGVIKPINYLPYKTFKKYLPLVGKKFQRVYFLMNKQN